jgi:hypothetical protein
MEARLGIALKELGKELSYYYVASERILTIPTY